MKNERNTPVDLSSRYRREIYLVTFPLGAVLSTGYLWISASKIAPVNVFLAASVSILLTGLFVMILVQPGLVSVAETIFYFSMSVYFIVYSHSNINQPERILLLTEEQLSDVITGMGMWLVIMSIGAFLTLPIKQFKGLVVINFLVILMVATINLYLLFMTGGYRFGFLYRWLNIFFALVVAILLILRIGLLQQQYASTDPLTGLLNRRAMYETLTREIHRSDRFFKTFTVVLFDLDRFKSVNDTYGHNAGDHTLKEIAAIVHKQIRSIDCFSRWGGEEFLIALLETDLAKGCQVAERIRTTMDEYTFSQAGHLTGSFGVTAYSTGQSLDELLHSVDQAMYTAKNSGGNRVAVPDTMAGVENL